MTNLLLLIVLTVTFYAMQVIWRSERIRSERPTGRFRRSLSDEGVTRNLELLRPARPSEEFIGSQICCRSKPFGQAARRRRKPECY